MTKTPAPIGFTEHPAMQAALPILAQVANQQSSPLTKRQCDLLVRTGYILLGQLCVADPQQKNAIDASGEKISAASLKTIRALLSQRGLEQPEGLNYAVRKDDRASLIASIDAMQPYFSIQADVLTSIVPGTVPGFDSYVLEAFSRAARGLPLCPPLKTYTPLMAEERTRLQQVAHTSICTALPRNQTHAVSLHSAGLQTLGLAATLSKRDIALLTRTEKMGPNSVLEQAMTASGLKFDMVAYDGRAAITSAKLTGTPSAFADIQAEVLEIITHADGPRFQDNVTPTPLLVATRTADVLRSCFLSHARCYRYKDTQELSGFQDIQAIRNEVYDHLTHRGQNTDAIQEGEQFLIQRLADFRANHCQINGMR